MSEDETAGRHHRRNGHELGQTLRIGEGQRGLACCSLRDCKELDTTAAAAVAKSLQSHLTLCNSIDGSPPVSPVPGIL